MVRSDDEDHDAAQARSAVGAAATLVDSAEPGEPDPRRSHEELVPGAEIGRYRLGRRIGAGTMGVVWAALDPQLDRKVAIKLVHPSLARSPEGSARLLREARAMAKLSHRAVVTIHDSGEVDGRLFLAMELVDGTTLGQLLRARSADELRDWTRWLVLLLDAGHGLAAAHREGVLHRDFKPDNVLVDRAGRVCVGDFGLATLADSSRTHLLTTAPAVPTTGGEALALTSTGALVGTPIYMSPQALRGETLDARADQFSFCVATWEALYGQRPFEVPQAGLDAIPALAESIERGALASPPADSAVPAAVHDVLRRGLAADPASRWPTMDALLSALEVASGVVGAGSGVRASAITTRTPRSPSRARWYLGGAALVTAIALAVAVVVIARRPAARTAAPPPASTPPAAPAIASPEKLFGVSMRTVLDISPDHRIIATGQHHVEVRDLVTGDAWQMPLQDQLEVSHVELNGDVVRFGARGASTVLRWDYRANKMLGQRTLPGTWYGSTARGDLAFDPIRRELTVSADGGGVLRREVGPIAAEAFTISPNRKRVAYLESDRFTGRLVVWDVEQDTILHSETLLAPTSVAWRDDVTLLYGTGTHERPAIHGVRIEDGRISRATQLHSAPYGWFGYLRVEGDRLYFVDLQPSPRTRFLDRTSATATSRDLDRASTTIALGWASDDEFFAWSSENKRVTRRTERALIATTPVRIEEEPVNATRADDLLIVATRRPTGREVAAHALADGSVRWRRDDLIAVRCAGDRRPPCYAIRSGSPEQVLSIDPATGELGTVVLYAGIVEDVAVREDGARLLVTDWRKTVRELDAAGAIIATYPTGLANTRSLAYDPKGGILVAGTFYRNTYQVGTVIEGAYAQLLEAANDILALVRPSPSGAGVLVYVRTFSPNVSRLDLPR